MQESTFDLITELCSGLVNDGIPYDPLVAKRTLKRFRSQAFGIVLSNRCIQTEDQMENDPTMTLVDIIGHIYWKGKSKGQWTEETMKDVNDLIEKADVLAKSNSSVQSVLKFLLCMADSNPTIVHQEEPSYGLDMSHLIMDHNLKHKSLINSPPMFNSDIFELHDAVSSESIKRFQILNEMPGTGLKHQSFFTSPLLSSSTGLNNVDECDIINANWILPKLQTINSSMSNVNADSRVHQDEGYVTPDQDLVHEREPFYIPWEDMYKEDFQPVYSWEGFSSAVISKEPSFVFQRRDAIEEICKVIHAFDAISSESTSGSVTLRTVSLEELEVAFKNLLIGVESTIFQYNHCKKSFVLQNGLFLKGSSARTLKEYCEDFIECGNRFRQLNKVTSFSRQYGLIFQTLCNNIRHYLQCYRGVVLSMPTMQSLLETRDWLYKLYTQLQFLVSLCAFNSENRDSHFLTHLYNQMPVLSRHDLSFIYYYILQSCCSVYFGFLSKWMFEGVIDGIWQKEFFIKTKPLTENVYDQKFWCCAFELDRELVPGFLVGLEREVMLCGKSMALLNLCSSDDPICKLVKEEHPEIICCFNKTDLKNVEEQFKSYKEKCRARCQELFGSTAPEPHEDDYYAELRAKTLNKIKESQAEEKRLKAERKLLEFNNLKKNMEDAEARKMEERKNLLEEEERLLEESEKIEQLNEIRREEERKKMVQFYSVMSEAADRRRELAEWKIKRAELHEKRCEFLKKDEKGEDNEVEDLKDPESFDSKHVSAEKSLEKYLETYCQIPGSDGFVVSKAEKEEGLQEVEKSIDQDIKVEPSEQFSCREQTKLKDGLDTKSKLNYHPEITDAVDKRDWLIALDVADQARQSALKFKQRNMFNDYNILTGEETTFESRFGEKHIQEEMYHAVHQDNAVPINTDNQSYDSSAISETCESKNIELKTVDCEVGKDNVMNGGELRSNKPSVVSTSAPKTFITAATSIPLQSSNPELSNKLSTVLASDHSKTDLNEIDMTSIYQNLRRSVMIPLLTQLELTNDAILRLFLDKHNLLKHIECIWKYFFLLEGEFARSLTKNLFEEVQKVQHPSYLLNVMKMNSILRCSVGATVEEEYTERLSFYVKEIPPVFRMIDPGMLDCLSLRYKTHWPINVIISEDQIIKQDFIFKFLLKIHRMSWALEEEIYLLKDKRLLGSLQYRQVQLFRHSMTHFISVFKNYITGVALEDTWLQFNQNLRKAATVDDIHNIYSNFIAKVKSRCLLGKKAQQSVKDPLNSLFKSILSFHEALRSGEWIQDKSSGSYQHSNFSCLSHNFNNFMKLAAHFTSLFKRAVDSGYPNIVQLSTMLSFNDFYKIKED